MKSKMKLKFLAAGAALCALGMTGCTHETDEAGAQKGKQTVMTMQSATDVPQTRADYTEDGTDNTKMNFSWRSGDKMSVVVDGVSGNENCELTTTEAGKSVPFSGTVTTWTGTKNIYAVYPFSSTAYTISGGTTTLTLPNPQHYTVDGAISNSFMVGMGTATANNDAITASASLKQVMSIIKLNITNAPAKVIGVKLKCTEAIFPTTATVTLSDATITNPGTKVQELSMTVTDNTTEATKAVSFAMFPTDLTGKKIQVEVSFQDGKSKTIEKNGMNFLRNMHYAMAFDAKEEPKSITWATGNLVADGNGGCRNGDPTDNGLYFQFGSLIGWSLTGDPTIVVKPSNFNSAYEDWSNKGKIWQGTTGTVPFTVVGSGSADEIAGIGDPCHYYLGGTWRLPTKDEYVALFNNTTTGWTGATDWSWVDDTNSATHTDGLTFTAASYRLNNGGGLVSTSKVGFYWSATPYTNATNGYRMSFNGSVASLLTPKGYIDRVNGLSVRCVSESL